MSKQPSHDNYEHLIDEYLLTDAALEEKKINKELEVRFGTRGVQRITKIDYDNVIEKLISMGFYLRNNDGNTILKIQNDVLDEKTGKTKLSKLRFILNGITNVQQYCKTNQLHEEMNFKIEEKKEAIDGKGKILSPVNVDKFNFRVSYTHEREVSRDEPLVQDLITNWKDSKKVFRYMKRYQLIHKEYPIIADLSIVKTSKRQDKFLKSEYNIADSGIFDNYENYEIELELDNNLIAPKYNNTFDLLSILKKNIKFVLSGLQESNYPITIDEQQSVGEEYFNLINPKERLMGKLQPKMFIGPSSYTLQHENIAEITDTTTVPNIRTNYTVTEKADGIRKLLFINKQGKIYLIDTNMKIQFTGGVIANNDLFNTLFDGEHILFNKSKDYINLFAIFDVYFINKKDVRIFKFIPDDDDAKEDIKMYRLPLLSSICKKLNTTSIISGKISPIRIEAKQFNKSNESMSIFECCKLILDSIESGNYEYETDGLIFTPSNLGVGMNYKESIVNNYKTTWDYSFKWKPPEKNTIDFLCSTKKNKYDTEIISNLFESGTKTSGTTLTQYKTLILRCGFDEKRHGYINPMQTLYEKNFDDIKKNQGDNYKPVPFYPSNPTDNSAHLCNIILKPDSNGNNQMFTEEDEVINDNTIVEFRYDNNKDALWKWIPIKVRYDKTSQLKQGYKNYGNAYHVANSNWYSIHNPITADIIGTGNDINLSIDKDVYYNKDNGKVYTKGLRNFHNLYVKNKLITSVGKHGDTLIDYAVGKGGDISKWINARLSFVFGIDLSKDNIENRLDGACARYLNYIKKNNQVPYALFVNGNSALKTIRDGGAIFSEKEKTVVKSIFGEGSKDITTMEKGVYESYGIGIEGFNISSCQFAFHYFFENVVTLENFMTNLSQCTKLGGHFIGGCYDGKTLFDSLSGKELNEGLSIIKDGIKIWGVKKEYTNTEFNDDYTSLGYAINIYQETIGQEFREYLVNFNYVNRVMENYGFILLTLDESKKIGFPKSSDMFSNLYNSMSNQDRRKFNLLDYEKQISFYNRYFIYRKVRNVDASKIKLQQDNVSNNQEIITKIKGKLKIKTKKKD